jgi:hypothetical protein
MNKLIIVFCFFSLSVFCSFGQSFNKELLKSYTKDEISAISKEDITVIEYAIENAIYFAEIPKEKNIDFPEIESRGASLNFTDYKLKIKNENQYFRIKNSDKLLVIKSMYVLKNELQNSKK